MALRGGYDVMESPFTESDARLFGTRPAGTVPDPQPKVPGVSVTEGATPLRGAPQPEVPGLRVSYGGIQDPGPGNPNVQRMGPPRPAGAPTITPEPALPAAAAEAAPVTQGGLRGFFTGVGDASVGGAIKSVAGGVGNLAKGAIRGNAALAAPIAAVNGLQTDTEDYAKRFGLEDTQPGVLRDLGIRALGVASDVGDAMGFGVPGRLLFRDKQGATDVTPRPVAAPAAAAPAGTAPAGNPNAQTDVQRAATAPPLDNSVLPGAPGKIQRQGNSFTNTGEFLTGSSGPTAQNDAAATNLASRSTALGRAGLRSGFPDENNLPAGYGTTIPGVNAPASQYEQELATRNAGVKSTLGGKVSPRIQAQMDIARMQNSTAQRGQDVQASTTQRGQDIGAQTARAGNQVTLRGQDLNYDANVFGHQLTARTAANTARLQQMNADRTYQFDVQKHGDEVAKQNFEMRQSAEKNVHEQIANMLPPGPDGKPDIANAARYATGLNAMVSQQQEVLRQRAAQGDRRAAAALDDLSKNGLGALDARTVRDFVNGMKVNDLRATAGTGRFNPIGGTDVITDTPAAGLRKSSDGIFGFGGSYDVLDAAGRKQGDVPARYVEGDGSFFGGKRRTDLRDFVR